MQRKLDIAIAGAGSCQSGSLVLPVIRHLFASKLLNPLNRLGLKAPTVLEAA